MERIDIMNGINDTTQTGSIIGGQVINGIPILVKMTEMAIKLKRLTGLTVSRTSDFSKPSPELIEEFLANPKGL